MPPLLWPLACLAGGILLAPVLDVRYAGVLVPLACLLGWARPRLLLIAIGLLGLVVGSGRNTPAAVVPGDASLPDRVDARIVKAPWRERGGIYFVAEVLAVGGHPIPSRRARLAWFPDDYGSSDLFDGLDLGHGDRLDLLVELRQPTSYRVPGVFDYRRQLKRQGIQWVGTIRSPRLIEVHSRGWHGLDRLRRWTTDRIAGYFSDPGVGAVILGMVLGRRRTLPPGTEQKFVNAGLIHLLVVSGFNLAVVAAAALALGRRLPMGRFTRTGSRIFALALVLAYALLVDGDAPVLRATLMASVLLIGTAIDRGYAVGNALALTAMGMLCLAPDSTGDLGFELSFGATLAILAIGAPTISWALGRWQLTLRNVSNARLDRHLDDPVVDRRVTLRLRAESAGWPLGWITLPRAALLVLAETAMLTAAVQLSLSPFAIESFHRLSPVSIPLNVAGALVATVVTPMGLMLPALPGPLGHLVAGTLSALVDVLIGLVDLGLALPGATMRVPSPPHALWLAFAPGLLLIALGASRRHRGAVLAGWVLTLACLALMVAIDFSPTPPQRPVLSFLDVGQGDSTLVELPDGRVVVIDGGGVSTGRAPSEGGFRVGEEVVSQHLFYRRFRRIDILVLTHAHHDHLDGLRDLVSNFEIGEIWLGPNPMVPEYRAFLEAVYARSIPIRHVRTGQEAAPFEVLSPERERSVGRTVSNDDSVVLLLRWGPRSALLAGDLEAPLRDAPDWVDVLKVPHHGSANTRLATRAGVPVISVGAHNRFGHPGANRLPALRTDLLGTIRVSLDQDRPRVTFPGLR